MNVTEITMPKAEARRRLRAYRTSRRTAVDQEYQAAVLGYQALAAGHAVLDLAEVFRVVETDLFGRPRLAIARADHEQVRVHVESQTPLRRAVFDVRWNRSRPGRLTEIQARIPATGPKFGAGTAAWFQDGFALVPLVPPEVLRHHARDTTHVLWEVEEWADRAHGALADRDPYLLRHLGGSLWVVLGAWDLTDLERAIMAGRANR